MGWRLSRPFLRGLWDAQTRVQIVAQPRWSPFRLLFGALEALRPVTDILCQGCFDPSCRYLSAFAIDVYFLLASSRLNRWTIG
jgi:hypothetical protein